MKTTVLLALLSTVVEDSLEFPMLNPSPAQIEEMKNTPDATAETPTKKLRVLSPPLEKPNVEYSEDMYLFKDDDNEWTLDMTNKVLQTGWEWS